MVIGAKQNCRNRRNRRRRRICRKNINSLPSNKPVQYIFPLNFVIFVDPDTNTGFLTETEINAQINSTNTILAKYPIRVQLFTIKYVYSSSLHNDCGLYKYQESYRKLYSESPESIVNIYVCNLGVLGFVMYFPTAIQDTSIWNGIHVDYRTFPSNNSFPSFNEGDTLTHEFGHYLGLFHTFNNNNCDGDNDGIDDTPIEKTNGFGTLCFTGRDSCPQDGVDPLFNMMDYTDDICMREFTPKQIELMIKIIQIYKPRTITMQI